MGILEGINLELIATGLAGLVLLQLAFELRAIHRRFAGRAERRSFLQVQVRRMMPGESGERSSQPNQEGGANDGQ